jgi:hypothetical protein
MAAVPVSSRETPKADILMILRDLLLRKRHSYSTKHGEQQLKWSRMSGDSNCGTVSTMAWSFVEAGQPTLLGFGKPVRKRCPAAAISSSPFQGTLCSPEVGDIRIARFIVSPVFPRTEDQALSPSCFLCRTGISTASADLDIFAERKPIAVRAIFR